MEYKLKLSIVIPTYNREDSALNLIDELFKLLNKDTEIIVVEQKYNNSDKFSNLLKKKNIKIKYFFLKEASLPHARNIGIQNASGEIILFLDDDVKVSDMLLESHIKNYSDKRIGGVAGRVITPGQKIETNKTNVGRINIFGNFSDGFSSSVRQEVDTVIGCNSSWRKDILLKLGGFDEEYTGNAIREDSDMSLRVKKLGYKIIFDPKSEVVHLRAPEGGSRKSEGRIKWYFDFFSNETYFFLKHRPKLLLPLMFIQKYEWFIRCFFSFTRNQSVSSSLFTPFLGIINGGDKYKKYENRG